MDLRNILQYLDCESSELISELFFTYLRKKILTEIQIQQSKANTESDQYSSNEQGSSDDVKSKSTDTCTFQKLHIEGLEEIWDNFKSLKITRSEEKLPIPIDTKPEELINTIIQESIFPDQGVDSVGNVGKLSMHVQQEETQGSNREEELRQEIILKSKEPEALPQDDNAEDEEKGGTPSQNIPEEKSVKSMTALINYQNLIPRGVAIHPETHDIFVADWNCKCIRIFGSDAKYTKDMELRDNICPWGITLSNNNLYITDNRNNKAFRVEMKLNHSVELINSNFILKSPRGIAVTSNDETLIIADCNNDKIVLYENGKPSYLESYVLKRPVHVEIIERDLYIMCMCLKEKYREVYILKHHIGSQTYNEILRETDVNAFFFCIHQDIIYISDMLAHCIKIYDITGHKMGKLPKENQEGHEKGQLFYPSGIVVNKRSQIIIASSNKHNRIQIFEIIKQQDSITQELQLQTL